MERVTALYESVWEKKSEKKRGVEAKGRGEEVQGKWGKEK